MPFPGQENTESPKTDLLTHTKMTESALQHNAQVFDRQDKLEVIDAFRGYAILLVITVHSLQYVPELVWPVRRLFSVGFYGVQLFFIASAITLLMSWHRAVDTFGRRASKFLLRRFFRIAPLYYSAILIYWYAYQVHPLEFSIDTLLATLLFYNAWSPYLIPTVPGWTPVPGGWSISVEFCFYFLFPVFATVITNLKRAFNFFLIALFILIVGHTYGKGLYQNIPSDAVNNFLYFWPPNQLIAFALGFVLYYLIKSKWVINRISNTKFNGDHATLTILFTLSIISFYGVRKFFDFEIFSPPTHLIISIVFVPWMLLMILKPGHIFVNFAIVGLGKVSFSAYILHFAVLRYGNQMLSHFWPLEKSGVFSILYEFVLLLLALVITRLVSELAYRFIELPFVEYGKNIGKLL